MSHWPHLSIPVPEYPVGTPPTPPRSRATHTADDYTPCPPTPRCPSSCVHDYVPIGPDPGTSQSSHPSTSQLRQPTTFVASNDQTQYDLAPHVSDCLIYDRDREMYAYPSPVLAMIGRANLDSSGLRAQPVDPRDCGLPRKLFSLTAGYVPVTGLKKQDDQSSDYYSMLPLTREPSVSYCFPIGIIQALQQELCIEWRSVYPEPIPPVIIRSEDLIGYHCLSQGGDGYGFVLPAENSVHSTIRQRGIDEDFRPINPSATVETRICINGDALYYPQHIVASKFAVNVFLELPDSAGPTPLCKYMGAYVLQEVCQFKVQVPPLGHLHLVLVKFCYYKWDQCILGLADTSRLRNILAAC